MSTAEFEIGTVHDADARLIESGVFSVLAEMGVDVEVLPGDYTDPEKAERAAAEILCQVIELSESAAVLVEDMRRNVDISDLSVLSVLTREQRELFGSSPLGWVARGGGLDRVREVMAIEAMKGDVSDRQQQDSAADELAELVVLAQAGDEKAFARLYQATSERVHSLAYRFAGNHDDAAEIVQNVYLRVHRHIGKFRANSSFMTWLHRITVNASSTFLERRTRNECESLIQDGEGEIDIIDTSWDSDIEGRAEHDALQSILTEALSALSANLRAAIVLRDIYDLSHGQIAERLDISEAAVKVRVHRARKALKDILVDQGAL